jgi:outer membrane biosynthesis protein TonB
MARISKKVRKSARRAIRAAADPLVRDIAAAAMAAADRVRRTGESRRRQDQDQQEEQDMCREYSVHVDGSKLAEAFRKAAADGLRTFLEGLEAGLREARGAMDDPQPEPQARPRAKAKPQPKPAAKPKPKPKSKAAAKPRPRARGA